MNNSGAILRTARKLKHCVVDTWRPFASDTDRGFLVFLLLITGVPSITNICILPESAIALPVLRGNITPAKLLELKGCPRAHDLNNFEYDTSDVMKGIM
jgi:hypothetical protein